MRKIYIQSKLVEFDGVISFRLLNPMFNDKVSYSFGCTSSMTPSIKDAIDDLHLPEVGYSRIQFEAMIVTDAFTFIGAVYFTSVTDESVTFQFNSQHDFWNAASVSIRSLSLPWDAEYFPIANSKAVDAFPLSGQYNGEINGRDSDGSLSSWEKTVPVPCLKFISIIRNILQSYNLSIQRDELNMNADISQLYMFNINSNATYKWESYYLYPGITENLRSFFVSIEDGKYKFNSSEVHNLKDGMYLAVVASVVRPIAAESQLLTKVFKITVDDEYTISIDITPAVDSLDGSAYSNFVVFSLPVYNGLISEETRNHLPEITAAEFLKEVEKLFGCRFFVDESSNDVRVFFLKNILKSNDVEFIDEFAGMVSDQQLIPKDGFKLSFTAPSDDDHWSSRIKDITDVLTIKEPVSTFTSLPTSGNVHNDLRLVIDQNAYYRYYSISFLATFGWEFYSENNLPMSSDGGEYSISTKFSPLLVQNFARTLMIPTCNKEGKFIILGETAHEDFRLFFHRGEYSFQVFRNGGFVTVTLPLCNNDIYYPDGSVISGASLALRWDGSNGLYEKLYKEWIDFMVNKYREESRFVNWPLHMLNSFAWWKKYRINHMNYFVKSIDIDIGQNETVVKDTILVPYIGSIASNLNQNLFLLKYGALYNWYCVSDPRNMAPAGWHVWTQEEMYQVVLDTTNNYLTAGGALKEMGTDSWLSPNTGAVNSVGFNARGSGWRGYDGDFGDTLKSVAFFWASDDYTEENALGCALSFSDAVFHFNAVFGKIAGLSVRIVKDDSTDPGSVTGNDGKIYPTIKIGNMVIVSCNVSETRYRNGDEIPYVASSDEWIILNTGARCNYNNTIY